MHLTLILASTGFGKYDVPYLFAGESEHRYDHTENDTVENVQRVFYLKVAETVLTLFTLLDAQQPFLEKRTAP